MKKIIIIGLIAILILLNGCSNNGDLHCKPSIKYLFMDDCKQNCIKYIEENCNYNITANCDDWPDCEEK